MTRRPRRHHTRTFKAKVALNALKSETPWPNWCSRFTCTPTRSRNALVNFWRVPPICLLKPARRSSGKRQDAAYEDRPKRPHIDGYGTGGLERLRDTP